VSRRCSSPSSSLRNLLERRRLRPTTKALPCPWPISGSARQDLATDRRKSITLRHCECGCSSPGVARCQTSEREAGLTILLAPAGAES
jgi:hypothetical protein